MITGKQRIDDLTDKVETLTSRIARLENFITKDQNEWSEDEDLLRQGGLSSVIKSVVESDFWASVSAEFRRNS